MRCYNAKGKVKDHCTLLDGEALLIKHDIYNINNVFHNKKLDSASKTIVLTN
jgi:hypothetical protein